MRIPLTALAAAVCFCAQAQVVVDEARTRAHLVNGKTAVTLALKSERERPVQARIELQWLGPENRQQGLARAAVTVQAGQSAVEIPMPVSERIADPLLERLRYQLDPAEGNFTAFDSVRGILSFAHIADYAFSLRVIAPNLAQPGKNYELRVLAFHPLTGRPVAGVNVECLKSKAVSNKNGLAVLRMVADPDDDDTDLTITARIGDLSRTQDAPQIVFAPSQVRIQCDKPIYQPGQTMHVRILALAADGKAQAGAEHTIKIFNESEDVEHAATLTTSRFGVAATDWEIPDNVKPGEYRIQVEAEEGESNFPNVRMVSIRRYELPSFRVSVRADRTYYLSRQKATIDIQGDYLFGKPLSAGKVVITEGDDKAPVGEGKLNAAGQFRAMLDVGDSHFNEARFVDRHFTAFVTDPSTNRTEQRKFDLRASKDSLHVYVAREESTPNGRRIYVTTYSPDGTPARSDVMVLAGSRLLATAKTSRFGVARLDFQSPDEKLLVRAVTNDGRRAEQELQAFDGAENTIWLQADHALYRAGDAVKCTISALEKNATALLMAWNAHGQVVFSRHLQLKDGNAVVGIPYDPKFGKELELAAVSGSLGPAASRMVLFPRAEELGLRVVPVRNEYRPGETAKVEFRASSQAALGIAIVDQSVLERASTDAAFGPRRWFDSEENGQINVGGIRYSDLLNLDPAKIDDGLQRVAEILAADPHIEESFDESLAREQSAYVIAIGRELRPLRNALDESYQRTLDYPRDEEAYLRIANTVSAPMLDPWMKPYFTRFAREGPNDMLRVCSAGPDKRQGTSDDFCPLEIERKWFSPFESVIRDSLPRLDDYPATNDEFLRLVDNAGIRFDHLRDPWGTSLRSAVAYDRDKRVIRIASAGPDRQWGTGDDFTVVEFRGSYFAVVGTKIEQALTRAKQFPSAESDFRTALSASGLNWDELHDPWGRRYYVTLRSADSYQDRTRVYTYEEYQGLRESRKELVPSKRSLLVAEVKSAGEDGIANTYDDFTVMSFFGAVESPLPEPGKGAPSAPQRLSVPGTGSIVGVVTDPSGATIPNAQVTLNDTYTTHANNRGEYIFRGIPGGFFHLKFEAQGFQTGLLAHVPVEPDHVTKADFMLTIGVVSEAVEVAAAPNTMASESAEVAAAPNATAIATPRVREYFPETLYWNPELITDAAGHAAMEVKLADTITSWHIAIIASAEDGRMTETSADIRAFQPFQVDLDVPSVLTEGDRITLPVPVRNYLAQPQTVNVTAQTPGGLALEQLPQQPGSIAPSTSANVLLSLRADMARKDARLRVTAIGGAASDAIEKSAAIHPNGERIERSVTGVVNNGQLLRMDVPGDVIPGSVIAEIKIYPTLIARLLEAAEALLQRPYGCAEQTISSAYPNLLFLKALKSGGLSDAKLEARAMRNLRAGYARLLGYQSDQGGFQYWATSKPDAALTAYALGFLTDAKAFLEIDPDRVEAAQKWLAQQNLNEPGLRGLTLWALVKATAPGDTETIRQLGQLARKAAEFEDPYALAAFALAAMDAGKADLAENSIRRLSELAKDEQGAVYWALRANTPFHGWGRAGQVETTALVLSAFAKWQKLGRTGIELAPLIDRGALFLLKNTDSSGAWSSSQSTVRALLSLLEIHSSITQDDPSTVELLVNGSSAGRIAIGNSRAISGPTIVSISRLMRPGATNEIGLLTNGRQAIQLQFNAAWYQPWTQPRTAKDFTLETTFNTITAEVNQPVTCDVKVTRPAFRGYGMMIAEIGLPPGVEVDRGTLTSILDDPKSGVDSFEVAPDHVTFYVWPQARDSNFKFTFRPRYAMKARMAPSVLYDYYNPEEQVLLVPPNFTVN